MPLNDRQKQIIQASIEHFFIWDNDLQVFNTEIKKIIAALNEKPTDDTDNPLLKDIFYHPGRYFLNLTSNDPAQISLHEIQTYILELLQTAVAETVKNMAGN